MRYAASEKLEIIHLVEGSHLSVRLTLAKLGISCTTFYRWYDRYLQRGEVGLQDQSPMPKHVWNPLRGRVVCGKIPKGAFLARYGGRWSSWR